MILKELKFNELNNSPLAYSFLLNASKESGIEDDVFICYGGENLELVTSEFIFGRDNKYSFCIEQDNGSKIIDISKIKQSPFCLVTTTDNTTYLYSITF